MDFNELIKDFFRHNQGRTSAAPPREERKPYYRPTKSYMTKAQRRKKRKAQRKQRKRCRYGL